MRNKLMKYGQHSVEANTYMHASFIVSGITYSELFITAWNLGIHYQPRSVAYSAMKI